jgi:hypothetical protein
VYGALAGAQASALEIEVLSSAPELVTTGDALIKVTGVTGVPRVTLNDRVVNVNFGVNPDKPGDWIGVLFGLVDGRNDVIVQTGRDTATITLTNHPINATLFAGPQDAPFLCELDSHGLRPSPVTSLDPWRANCLAAPVVSYHYRNAAGEWVPFDARGERPTDIATGANGMPMIIRNEVGVINRAAFAITIPHDPAAGPLPNPTDRGGSMWNGKLVYAFGPGARADGHHQGRNMGLNVNTRYTAANGNWFIENGYALASSSLNVFGTTQDAIVSAETAYKVKEHFIEQFGPPLFTIGTGNSGGSMQQQIISNAYPGILDGLMPGVLFADSMTFQQPMHDCELLANVLSTGDWTREQLDAISGKYWGFCISNGARYPNKRADNCDTATLAMIEEDPNVNPEDVRCTFQDDLVQVFGTDPETGFARSPWDNVGVQYGLVALNDGLITFEQFIDINQRIGGHDINGAITPDRQVGDPAAIQAAYETGLMNLFNVGGGDVASISVRGWREGDPYGRGDANVDVHDGYHSAIVEARLQKYTGTTDNYVQYIFGSVVPTGGLQNTPEGPTGQGLLDAVQAIDGWLTAVVNDTSDMTRAQKIAAHRPVGNSCWAVDGNAAVDWSVEGAPRGTVEKITDWDRCQEIFQIHSDPRIAAGGPIESDILKCQLKPIDAADYAFSLSADQTAQLQATFPDGVCDWTKPSVGFAEATAWLTYSGNSVYSALN